MAEKLEVKKYKCPEANCFTIFSTVKSAQQHALVKHQKAVCLDKEKGVLILIAATDEQTERATAWAKTKAKPKRKYEGAETPTPISSDFDNALSSGDKTPKICNSVRAVQGKLPNTTLPTAMISTEELRKKLEKERNDAKEAVERRKKLEKQIREKEDLEAVKNLEEAMSEPEQESKKTKISNERILMQGQSRSPGILSSAGMSAFSISLMKQKAAEERYRQATQGGAAKQLLSVDGRRDVEADGFAGTATFKVTDIVAKPDRLEKEVIHGIHMMQPPSISANKTISPPVDASKEDSQSTVTSPTVRSRRRSSETVRSHKRAVKP
jgi:hypothetical protein